MRDNDSTGSRKEIRKEVKFKVDFNDIYLEGEKVFRGTQTNEFAR
jgi:hypothetical protein